MAYADTSGQMDQTAQDGCSWPVDQLQGDDSLGGLVKQLSKDMSKLVRQEVALARAEMTEKAGGIGKAVVPLLIAAFFSLFAAGVLSACIVLAIAIALPTWLAALIVGAAYLVIAGILAMVGVRMAKRVKAPVPRQTLETVKEDLSWARHPTRSAEK